MFDKVLNKSVVVFPAQRKIATIKQLFNKGTKTKVQN